MADLESCKNKPFNAVSHVVLYNPVIPQNTGSIARLCAATSTMLHLIEPLGFSLSDKYLKRAGLDYWPEVSLATYASWQEFLDIRQVEQGKLWLFTTRVQTPYYSAKFSKDDYLVFGSETIGVPDWMHEQYADRRRTIPMDNENVRSLNLSNSVGIVVYELRRQLNSDVRHDGL